MAPALVIAALVLLAPVGLVGPVAAEPSAPAQASCAPPCGEINPRLIIRLPELGREPFEAAPGDQIRFEGTITYWFDADDEGYTPPDPAEPIEITFSFPKLPPWAELTLEPMSIPVDTTCATCFNVTADDPAAPQVHFEQRTPITLTLTILDEPERTPGYDYGKVQLFAKSTESGIYNPGYGIRELRVQAGGEAIEADGLFGVPGPSALLVVLAGILVAAAARRA